MIRRVPFWALLGVALALALAVGSGAFSSAPPTAAQRATALESVIRCPTCEDLSAANSSAEAAVTVRATIRRLIAKGDTDQQIKSYLAARYGSSIILDPPASGWSLLVWVLPLVGGLAAFGVLGYVVVTRRHLVEAPPSEAAAAEERAERSSSLDDLDQRRRFLEQSLADAYAEHRAGDLSDHDYQVFRRRDTARLAVLDLRMAALAEGSTGTAAVGAADGAADGVADGAADGVADGAADGVADGAADGAASESDPVEADGAADGEADSAAERLTRPKRSRRQRVLVGGAVTAFGSAIVLLVALFASNQLPGQAITGNVALSQQEQAAQTLAQAAALENQNQLGQAAQLYHKVLAQNPKDEVALAQLGWLEYEIGQQGADASLIANGRNKLEQAVKLDPGDYAVRLYLGTVLLQLDHDPAGAVAQYKRFLAANPPGAVLAQAAPTLRQAYGQAGVPVPAGVPAG